MGKPIGISETFSATPEPAGHDVSLGKHVFRKERDVYIFAVSKQDL